MKNSYGFLAAAILALAIITPPASAQSFDETRVWGTEKSERSSEKHLEDSLSAELEERAREGTLAQDLNSITVIGCYNSNSSSNDSEIDTGSGDLTQNCDNSGDVTNSGSNTSVSGDGGFGDINVSLPVLGSD